MFLHLDNMLPFGKFRDLKVSFILKHINPDILNYMIWWNKTVAGYQFDDEILKILNDKQKYYHKIREDYRIQEHMRDKSYDDLPEVKNKSKGWDLPIDDKPLESYLYN